MAGLALCALTARGESVELYGRLEQFTWKEFIEGDRILKEDGPRVGVGVRGIIENFNAWRLGLRAEGVIGSVDYDGMTMGGEPAKDKTDYLGLRAEIYSLLVRPSDNAINVHPILGIGSRYWVRRLAQGIPDRGGYDEGWLMVYGQLGAQIQCAIAPDAQLYANAIFRPAIYNTTYYSIELDDEETFWLKPGKRPTWEVEAGLAIARVRFSVFYETLSFSESNVHVVPPLEAFQPKSEGKIIGAQIGVLW
ncbi:MAG: hypothetical protein M5U15_12045 [Kiritimatiellae bacterium]|nr:hypothetical protein [Kiritimatiellia bacterium]